MSAPLTIIYVGGVGRSGSTVLDRLLGAAPDAVSVGELMYLWRNFLRNGHLCGCGAKGTECPSWGAVLARAFPEGPPTPDHFQPLMRRLTGPTGLARRALRLGAGPAAAELEEMRSAFGALYAAIAAESGRDIIIDSSKNVRLAIMLNGMPGVEIRLVHLIRDSRASAFSWTRVRSYPVGGGVQAPMLRLAPRKTARWWAAATVLGTLAPITGLRTKRVHYEDLVARPNETVSAIRQWARLPAAAPPVGSAGVAPLGVHHSVSGNPMRFDQGATPIRLDDEWRRAMPGRDKAVVTVLTLPWLLAYRYLLPGGRLRRT